MSEFDQKRWPDFTASEISCRCCGELYIDQKSMDALQAMRDALNKPLVIIRGHSCADHNAVIGGAKNSRHLQLAFDISAMGHDRAALYAAAERAGFNGFGFMERGLHVDIRPTPAHWDYGPASRRAWDGIMPAGGSTFVVHQKTGEGIA